MAPTTAAASPLDPRVERQVASLARWRWGFLALLVVVPAGCHELFERQASRLDALSEHGARTSGTIARIERQGGAAYATYEYTAGGATHSWSVSQADAPGAVGSRLEVLVLPEAPSFSRPTTARVPPAEEAVRGRCIARWFEGGATYLFAAGFVLCEASLRRLLRRRRSERDDAADYRRRLWLTAALFAPLLFGIGAWHWQDAAEKGESVWPVALGLALGASTIRGTLAYAAKNGPTQAATRSARVLRWVAPLALGLALVRALVSWFG